MAKAVLISIRPEWVEKILSGEKTLEIRKARPKLEMHEYVFSFAKKWTTEEIVAECMDVIDQILGDRRADYGKIFSQK